MKIRLVRDLILLTKEPDKNVAVCILIHSGFRIVFLVFCCIGTSMLLQQFAIHQMNFDTLINWKVQCRLTRISYHSRVHFLHWCM